MKSVKNPNQHLILSVKRKIQQSIQKLIQPSNAPLLVAVSGGQDSLCLLHVMLNLPKEWGIQVIVGHTDHQWDTDEGIAAHVKYVCSAWEVPCFVKTPDTVLKQTENAARQWRRKALIEIAKEKNCSYIVLGHTQTDSTETSLFNLLRGSDIKGLCGIPVVNHIAENITLVRPMLQVSREETGLYCESLGLPVLVDVLNQSNLYTRCRIRNQVMPLLRVAVNAKAEEHIASLSESLAETEDYMDSIAQRLCKVSVCPTDNVLHISMLKTYHIAIQKRVIKLWIERNQTTAVKRSHINDIVHLYSTKNSGAYACLAEGHSIRLRREILTYYRHH